jgi:hypothetical protein
MVASRKFRIAKIASTFTVEALAIGDTLDIIKKIVSQKTIIIFPYSATVFKGITISSK